MGNRLTLHEKLCEIINITEPNGDRHVYYQPPASILMKYPAIKYSRSSIDNRHASNSVYKQFDAYEIIVIDPNPDSEYVRAISKLPRCRFGRHYTADNLNHDTFTIYI